MGRFTDLTGQRFGRLTVISRSDFIKKDGKRETAYICKCDCGNETKVLAYNLKNGHTTSCGCLLAENRGKANATHHESRTRLYRIWARMRRRCVNPIDPRYEMYGGRGIKICDEWMNSYESFKNWSLSHGYQKNLSIDRINNNKGYSPDNCRWADQRMQSNNTRRNVRYTYNGETHTRAEWARIVGISVNNLDHRLKKGWDLGEALYTPVRKRSSQCQ